MRNAMKKLITLSFLALTVATGVAEIAPTENFVWADTDRNGSIIMEEFLAQRALWAKQRGTPHNVKQSEKIFFNKDRNKDGELSPEEYRLR